MLTSTVKTVHVIYGQASIKQKYFPMIISPNPPNMPFIEAKPQFSWGLASIAVYTKGYKSETSTKLKNLHLACHAIMPSLPAVSRLVNFVFPADLRWISQSTTYSIRAEIELVFPCLNFRTHSIKHVFLVNLGHRTIFYVETLSVHKSHSACSRPTFCSSGAWTTTSTPAEAWLSRAGLTLTARAAVRWGEKSCLHMNQFQLLSYIWFKCNTNFWSL